LSGPGGTLFADISGLGVRFGGLDDALAAALSSEWAPFLAAPSAGEPWLDVELETSDRVIPEGRVMRPSLTGEVRDGAARFWSDEGEITVAAAGRARVGLARGRDNWRFWGLVNLIAAAMAVRLPSRHGALLHAAGIVLDGRAFLLVGPEGAGKSTFAQAARQGGARVISDDTVVLDAEGDRLVLLGSPIRAHEATEPGPGRWPVTAVLHARRGTEPRLEPVGRLAVETLLVANLPFLASGWGRDARLDALVPFLAQATAYRAMTFGPDPGFLDLLRAFDDRA
jgi:hypothetical protein